MSSQDALGAAFIFGGPAVIIFALMVAWTKRDAERRKKWLAKREAEDAQFFEAMVAIAKAARAARTPDECAAVEHLFEQARGTDVAQRCNHLNHYLQGYIQGLKHGHKDSSK